MVFYFSLIRFRFKLQYILLSIEAGGNPFLLLATLPLALLRSRQELLLRDVAILGSLGQLLGISDFPLVPLPIPAGFLDRREFGFPALQRFQEMVQIVLRSVYGTEEEDNIRWFKVPTLTDRLNR